MFLLFTWLKASLDDFVDSGMTSHFISNEVLMNCPRLHLFLCRAFMPQAHSLIKHDRTIARQVRAQFEPILHLPP